jgi:hypothetical protein
VTQIQHGAWKASIDDVEMQALNENGETITVKARQVVRKPVCFMREILRMYSKPGDVALEFVAGSAPMTRACLLEGRICLGMDFDQAVVNAVRAHMVEFRKTVVSKLPRQLPKMKKANRGGGGVLGTPEEEKEEEKEEEEGYAFANTKEAYDVELVC